MIVFRNPGLIDLGAVRTMGVSVKRPGSFGYFGTGLKFSIATILRGGGSITLFCGKEEHKFGVTPTMIRGESFNIVTMNGESLGFTDQLGKNWEPWMVLRELVCNAKDEAGEFFKGLEPYEWAFGDEETTIIVGWADLDKAYDQRDVLFAEGDVLLEADGIQIMAARPEGTKHLYYRGVRVYETKGPCRFRYNTTEAQTLTEDRTLASDWSVRYLISKTLLRCQDREILDAALTTGSGTFEWDLKFEDASWVTPSTQFIQAVLDARARKGVEVSPSAKAVVAKHVRSTSEETVQTVYRDRADTFNYAVEYLGELGIKLDDYPVVVLDELPGGTHSLAEDGRIYVTKALMHSSCRAIATHLLMRFIDLECVGLDDTASLLVPLLLDQHPYLKASPYSDDDELESALQIPSNTEFAEVGE